MVRSGKNSFEVREGFRFPVSGFQFLVSEKKPFFSVAGRKCPPKSAPRNNLDFHGSPVTDRSWQPLPVFSAHGSQLTVKGSRLTVCG
jgi:hypothetical protein